MRSLEVKVEQHFGHELPSSHIPAMSLYLRKRAFRLNKE